MNTFPNGLRHTRAALKRYNSKFRISRRQKLMDAVRDNATMAIWLEAEKEDKDRVLRAFYHDSKNINSFDNCMLMDIATLEKWCAKAKDEESSGF
jgi:3-methyladenine DNA glycosylase Tag